MLVNAPRLASLQTRWNDSKRRKLFESSEVEIFKLQRDLYATYCRCTVVYYFISLILNMKVYNNSLMLTHYLPAIQNCSYVVCTSNFTLI